MARWHSGSVYKHAHVFYLTRHVVIVAFNTPQFHELAKLIPQLLDLHSYKIWPGQPIHCSCQTEFFTCSLGHPRHSLDRHDLCRLRHFREETVRKNRLTLLRARSIMDYHARSCYYIPTHAKKCDPDTQ